VAKQKESNEKKRNNPEATAGQVSFAY